MRLLGRTGEVLSIDYYSTIDSELYIVKDSLDNQIYVCYFYDIVKIV